MSPSLIAACLWVFAAAVSAALPSKRNHWPAAYVLIAAAVPILGFIAYQHGPWITLACLLAAGSILRWPIIHLVRWLRGGRP